MWILGLKGIMTCVDPDPLMVIDYFDTDFYL